MKIREVAIKSHDLEIQKQIANDYLEKSSGFALRKWEVGETEGLLFFMQAFYNFLPLYIHARGLW